MRRARLRHCVAGLVFVAAALQGAAVMGQQRIGFLSPAPRVARAPRAENRAVAWQDVPGPSDLQQDGVPSVLVPNEEEDLGTTVMRDTPTLAHDFPLEEAGCEPCGEPAADCGPGPAGCRPCFLSGWIHGEFLMWWPRPMDIPDLVTSGTTNSEGVLDQAGTQTLLGGELLNQMYSGARLRIGLWADPCHRYAWEADAFVIGEETEQYSFSGSGAAGSSVVARPFFNVLSSTQFPSGREDSELIAFPGQLSGTVTVEATSQLYGVGVHGMRTFCHSCGCGPSVLHCGCAPFESLMGAFVGWRHLNLDESLAINENLVSLLPSPDNGQFLIEDLFETDNIFNGVDLGVMWQAARGPFSVDMLMRLGIGSSHQTVRIDGSTTIRGSSSAINNFEDATGGMLAQRTNIGEYTRNRFAVVPELGVTVGCTISHHWRATVGYSFLYWSNVVRPGDQIDRDVNPELFPPETVPFTGLERPGFRFVETDLWVNGLRVGLERTW